MDAKNKGQRADLIQSLNKIANKHLNKSQAQQFDNFTANAMHFYPDADYLARPPEDIFWNLWRLCQFSAEARSSDSVSRAKVRVFNPNPDRDGWSSSHTTIYINQSDMPFLVDSLRNVLNRRGLNIFTLQSNPVWAVRNDQGAIKSIHSDNVVVKITADTGLFGWGEASPCPYIVGDTQATNYQTAQQLALLILNKDPLAIEARMTEINGYIVGESSIRSAYDMALYDMAAKAANMPLYQFLGGEQRKIRTDMTIGIQATVEQTLTQAKAIVADGFDAIKMKVGRQGLADVEHVKAVRELIGPDMALKIDSNQGWDYATAVANIKAMAPLNLQYSEQPLAVWDYANLVSLRDKVDLPICADESVFDDKDALKLVNQGAADYLNIKLGKAGGIHTGLKINAIAQSAGSKCMIGCFGEYRLALSAAVHLAIARPNIYFIDLDSAFDFKVDPVIGGMTYSDTVGGLISVDDSPGHGGVFDESFLKGHVSIS